MKLIIGDKNYSSWSMRPWLVLAHFGIPFDEELVRLDQPDTADRLRKLSPSGRVPVLVDGPAVIHESLAIIEYLHDKYPAKGIWPSDRLKRAEARSVATEMHAGFSALRQAAPMNIRAHLPGIVDEAPIAADLRRIEQIWGELVDESGGPFLFGKFSGADAMFAPVATRIRTYNLPVSDAALDYVEAIYGLEAFRRWQAAAAAEDWSLPRSDLRPAP